MTMVIDVGLERYFYGSDTRPHEEALERFVTEGFTKRVRDFVGDGIYEARLFRGKLRAGYLPDDERDAIMAEYTKLPVKYGDFSWDQVDRMGLCATQELALRLIEGAPSRFPFPSMNHHAPVTDIGKQLKWDWQGGYRDRKDVARLHRFARKHHMIIHTA